MRAFFSSNTIKQARRIVASELRSYDSLSRVPKLIRRDSHYQDVEKRRQADTYGPDKGYVCGHRVSLCEPCSKCQRREEDCVVYRIAMTQELKKALGL